jgi:Nuclease-related domain
MAKVLGESGRYVTQEAVRKHRGIWTLCLIGTALICTIWGFLVSLLFERSNLSSSISLLAMLTLGLLILFICRWSMRRLDALERERMQMRKGVAGETVVAIILGDLPDDYWVFNDIDTPSGNLDHVVIGPTGVFIIETKNWRGVVTDDGKRELLLNGKAADKRYVGQFVGRIMGTKDEIRKRAPELNPYFQAVFVFTSACVDVRWRTTGNVRCLRDDQLSEYIVDNKWNKKLTRREVDTLAQAFYGLARMDAGFCETEGRAPERTVQSDGIKSAPAHIQKGS